MNRKTLLFGVLIAALPVMAAESKQVTTNAVCQNGDFQDIQHSSCLLFASETAGNVDVASSVTFNTSGFNVFTSVSPEAQGPGARSVGTFSEQMHNRRAFHVNGSLFNTPGGHYSLQITIGKTTFPPMTDTNGTPILNNAYAVAEAGEFVTITAVSKSDENTSGGTGQASVMCFLTPAWLPK